MKTGDTLPDLVVNLTDNGTPVDLTAASSVVINATLGPDVLFTDTSPTIDADAGKVTHTWAAAETANPGRVWFEVVVTWPSGEQTFPDKGQLAVDIEGNPVPVDPILFDLDGVNDPWRWSPGLIGWISPAVEVTWADGDEVVDIGAVTGYERLELYVGGWDTWADASVLTPAAVTFSSSAAGGPPPISGSGSGVAFLVQYETGFAGPTFVPDPDLDVLDYLGDVTPTGVHDWPDYPA